MVDPAGASANGKRNLQLTRELQQLRETLPHPTSGEMRGYPVWFWEREIEIEKFQNDNFSKLTAS